MAIFQNDFQFTTGCINHAYRGLPIIHIFAKHSPHLPITIYWPHTNHMPTIYLGYFRIHLSFTQQSYIYDGLACIPRGPNLEVMGLETVPADSVDRWLLEQLAQPGGGNRTRATVEGRWPMEDWGTTMKNQVISLVVWIRFKCSTYRKKSSQLATICWRGSKHQPMIFGLKEKMDQKLEHHRHNHMTGGSNS